MEAARTTNGEIEMNQESQEPEDLFMTGIFYAQLPMVGGETNATAVFAEVSLDVVYRPQVRLVSWHPESEDNEAQWSHVHSITLSDSELMLWGDVDAHALVVQSWDLEDDTLEALRDTFGNPKGGWLKIAATLGTALQFRTISSDLNEVDGHDDPAFAEAQEALGLAKRKLLRGS